MASRAFEAPAALVAEAIESRARRRGRLARHAARRALRAPARAGPGDRGAPHRAGRGGQPRDRQDAHGVDPRGAGGGGPDHHLRRPDGGERRLPAPARELRGGRAQRRSPAALRRVRGDLALQLPRRALDQHGLGGADRGQHRGVQALRGDALDRCHPGRDRAGRGAARRRLQPGARRCGNRSRAGRRRRGRRGLHRLGGGWAGDRPGDAGGSLRPPRPHRDGRQEPGDRDRERGSGQGGGGRGARRPSGCRARSAAPARARSWRTRCTTSSWSAWPPSAPACRSAIPPTRPCSSARW